MQIHESMANKGHQPPKKIFRKILFIFIFMVILLFDFLNLQKTLLSFMEMESTGKDFVQEYVMASAVAAGGNPYQPLPTLVEQFIGPASENFFDHPSPHPPFIAVLFLPFSFLSYPTATLLWFFLEIGFVLISAFMLLKLSFQKPGFMPYLLFVSILLAWNPFLAEMRSGQLMILILVLLCLALFCIKSGKDWVAGLLLGLTISIKLITWPLLLWLVFTRRWRAVLAAGGAIVVLHLLAACFLGLGAIKYYYLTVSPTVFQAYIQNHYNLSGWALAWRVFAGIGPSAMISMASLPLLEAPQLAKWLGPVIPLIAILIGLRISVKRHDIQVGFAIMTCVAIYASPIVWQHYYVILIIPMVVVLQQLLAAQKMDWFSGGMLLLILLIMTIPAWDMFTAWMLGTSLAQLKTTTISFWVGLVSYIPCLANLYLGWLVHHAGLNRTATKSADAIPNEITLPA